ncbi:hypothetical protein [Natronospira bacteriovora]|uniref:Uncharacterized protein n=1 Tax=Natronospira bacteriovora TaxID=3069753 RepID=A0ABU0W7D8_9GAMM|nr:hypothetical protein [Natronospira sp. AB-CW4]MDQ2069921.1 hypothetical protein [Natronospira sp. AB-CW4]
MIIVALFAMVFSAQAYGEHPGVEFYGSYVWGHEVNIFQPCGIDAEFWVLADPPVLEELRQYHDEHTEELYQEIYIRFMGSRVYDEVDGFAADYDGLIEVYEILRMSTEFPDECP